MNRSINVFRRRTNIVDMMVPVTAGVTTYRLKWAQNFDGVFATIINAPVYGFYDTSIDRGKVDSQPSTGTSVRLTFDPATFAIPDTKSFWIQLFHLSGGPEVAVSAPSLLLPDSAHHGVGLVTIHGTAPNGASSAASLQLDLPRLMQDFHIHNEEGATNLFVATEQDGPEQMLPPSALPQGVSWNATQGSIWVRGGGATAAFSATFTTAFPR
jgi:hypothetical protein